MSNKKQTTAGLEPQASPCKQDVCRIAACNGGRVTNLKTTFTDVVVCLYHKTKEWYEKEYGRQLDDYVESIGAVDAELRTLHDLALATPVLRARVLHQDNHVFISELIGMSQVERGIIQAIAYDAKVTRLKARMDGKETLELTKSETDIERDRRFAYAARKVREEGLLKNDYDWAWIELYCERQWGLELFSSPQSFLDYLKMIGVEDLPLRTSVSRKLSVVKGEYPSWTFTDSAKPREVQRRKLIVGRFIFHFNKFNG